MAREIDLLQARCVEPSAEPLAQPIRPHRRVQPRQIDDVNLALGAQRSQQRRPPFPRASEAVNEHERLTASGDAVTDCAAVDLDLPKLDLGFGGVVHLIQSGRCLRGPTCREWSPR